MNLHPLQNRPGRVWASESPLAGASPRHGGVKGLLMAFPCGVNNRPPADLKWSGGSRD